MKSFVIILSVLVVALLVAASEISQKLQTSYGYRKPYFLTYFHTVFLGLLLPLHFVMLKCRCQCLGPITDNTVTTSLVQNSSDGAHHLDEARVDLEEYKKVVLITTGFRWHRLLLFSVPFCLLWFGSNFLFTVALPLTSVASGLCLEQSTTVFVFILSVLVLHEAVTGWKVLSVTVCLTGVALVGYGDERDAGPAASGDSILGDCLVIACAVAASLYMVLYKKYLCSLNLHGVLIWLGCIGVSCLMVLWPGLVIVHFVGWEISEWPSVAAGALLVGGSVAALLFNFTLNWGIARTQPLFMRLVTTCSIPVSFGVDQAIQGGTSPNWARIVGSVVVIAGFLLFSIKGQSHQSETTIPESDESVSSHDETQIDSEVEEAILKGVE